MTPQQIRVGATRLASELLRFRGLLALLIEPHWRERGPYERATRLLFADAVALARLLAPRTLPGQKPQPQSWGAVREAIRAVRGADAAALRFRLLCDLPASDAEIAACRWNGDHVSWSLCALVETWPVKQLDEEARSLARSLGWTANDATETRTLISRTPLSIMMRAFRRMEFETFMRRAETLLRLDPAAPDQVLALPASRFAPAFAQWRHPEPSAITSYLLASIMEVRANNQFELIRRAAIRVASVGGWSRYVPSQIFHILFRKWVVLHAQAQWSDSQKRKVV